jgi:antirestriction protein ArdC
VGRHVLKGARAIYILGPIARKVRDSDPTTGEDAERTVIRGFKAIPVFRLEDTEGDPVAIADYAPPVLPPLAEVAEAWAIKVAYRPDAGGGYYGAYSPATARIELLTHAEQTFFHELAHAAHHRLGGLTRRGQDPHQEIVAETSAAALCLMYGLHGYIAPAADYVAHYAGVAPEDAARAALQHLGDIERVLDLILATAHELAPRSGAA